MPEETEWQRLAGVIQHWNNHRLDMFEISQPSKTLDFSGVVRFYLEDHVAGNCATKCLRVGSSSTTREVIETLLGKFWPDMKMLSTPYCLYEVHADVERKLDLREKPLVVQLNWNTDNREGRFVLRNERDILLEANCHEKREKGGIIQNFKRTLSKKEKKQTIGDADLKTKALDPSRKEPLSCVTDKSASKKSPVSNPEHTLRHSEHRRQFNSGEVYSQSLRSDNSPQTCHHGDQPENMDQLQLPVGVKFRDNYEEVFLAAVINYTNSSTVHFKLSPAYVLYMAARWALQRHQTAPHPHATEQTHHVSATVNRMVSLIGTVIQKQSTMAGAVAFWMANASELLNFLKQDRDVSLVTRHAQEALAHLVHKAFKCLIHCLQVDLRKHMTAFLVDPEQQGEAPGIEGVVDVLTSAMSLLRRSRVNPALSIQVFSQLFHFVSAWLFNRLVGSGAGPPLGLLSHYWGAALRRRLAVVERWAERQGLELAADCHLGRIIQATMLLTMNKYSMQDAKDIHATCFKLNSLQLKKLMSSYLYAPNEPHIPHGLIDRVVSQSQASEDELAQSEARDIGLEESLELHLPFLLPEGGFSCDSVRGVPPGFTEFLEPLCRKGLCTLVSHPHSNGMWTVFFSGTDASSAGRTRLPACGEPEVVSVTLNKPLSSGMGVSIVAAKAAGHGSLGIYVKSIVKGGPAEMDGRLAAGDQLLSVDGHSLVGLPQERAAGLMMQTGPVVTLQVAKLGACYHGLDALLQQPPSTTTMDGPDQSNVTSSEKARFPNSSTGQNASGLWGNHHGAQRRKKEQTLLRNRPLYRSNPNMTDPGEPVDPVVARGRISAISISDLCSDACPRDYLTLPAPKPQDKKTPAKVRFSPSDGPIRDKRACMRQARSQDNLCVEMETGAPPADRGQRNHQDLGKGPISYYSSISIGPSISTQDLHHGEPSSTKRQQNKRTSGSGYWRTPASQNPVTSIQPIRIDVPATRRVDTHAPLTTFQQQNTTLPTAKSSQNPNSNERTHLGNQRPGFQAFANHAGPSPSANRQPQPTLSSPSPRQEQIPQKEQIILPPSRQISPQRFPPQRQTGTVSVDLSSDIKQELCDASGPSPDPWKREAREKLEKQQRLQAVDQLEQEVRELQAKAARTPGESDKLRRLTLEWQFQRRLQEFQLNGDDDDDDDEDEDTDVMMIMQQLEVQDRTQLQDTDYSKQQQHDKTTEQDEVLDKQAKTYLSREDKKDFASGKDRGSNNHLDEPDKLHLRENFGSKTEQERLLFKEPEKLPFRERQRLFSLGSSSTTNVKTV